MNEAESGRKMPAEKFKKDMSAALSKRVSDVVWLCFVLRIHVAAGAVRDWLRRFATKVNFIAVASLETPLEEVLWFIWLSASIILGRLTTISFASLN